MLHYARAARDLRDEQHSGVGDDIGLAAGGDEDQVNGVPRGSAAPEVNEGAVLDERGVERREREISALRVASEVGLEGLGGILERLAQAHNEDSFPLVFQGGLRFRKPAIDEDEPAASARGRSREFIHRIDSRFVRGGREGTKERFLERGKPGVLPVLVPGAGKAEVSEARDGGVPDLLEPAPITTRQRVAARPESIEVVRDGRGEVHVAAASSTIPAYPYSSRCNARSRSPDLTMRPSFRTWTKSGATWVSRR